MIKIANRDASVCVSPGRSSCSGCLPALNGQTFGERAAVLPDALKGKPTILVITFTRAAQDQARAWTENLKQKSLGVATYQVLELEDVPRLMRGFVRGSIRRGIPKERRTVLCCCFEGQDALKKVSWISARTRMLTWSYWMRTGISYGKSTARWMTGR
jgi:hypothetical protein